MEQIAVVHKSGLVLWEKTLKEVSGSPVNHLIQEVLIEERADSQEWVFDNYKMQWKMINDLDLVFVAVYQKIIQLLYIPQLLERMATAFVDKYAEDIKRADKLYFTKEVSYWSEATRPFDQFFEQNVQELEQKKVELTPQGSAFNIPTYNKAASKQVKDTPLPQISDQENCTKPKGKKSLVSRVKGTGKGSSGTKAVKDTKPTERTKLSKIERMALAQGTKIHEYIDPEAAKNMSEEELNARAAQLRTEMIKGDGKMNVDDYTLEEEEEEEVEEEEEEEEKPAAAASEEPKKRGWFGNLARNYGVGLGKRELDSRDFDALLPGLREKLISKNVAADIADGLCGSVATSLHGKTVSSFGTLKN
eukprot:gene3855-2236_t